MPGGRASYPSSLLMNAIPARVAGVERLVAAVPTPGGEVNPLVLLAARLAGVDTLYRVGGARATSAWRSAALISRNPLTGHSVVIERDIEDMLRAAGSSPARSW